MGLNFGIQPGLGPRRPRDPSKGGCPGIWEFSRDYLGIVLGLTQPGLGWMGFWDFGDGFGLDGILGIFGDGFGGLWAHTGAPSPFLSLCFSLLVPLGIPK